MIESHEKNSWRLFNQAIYICLIFYWVESSFWVKLLSQASQLNSSSWVQLFNSTQFKFKNLSTWLNTFQVKYLTWCNQFTDEHQSFKMTLSFVMLLLHTERSLTSLWSFTLSFHFCRASDALNRCFKEMHQVFLKWLLIIFRKYNSLLRNNDSNSQIFIKMKVKILVFQSLTLCSHLLMNLMSIYISHTFLWLLLMKIDFFKVVKKYNDRLVSSNLL